jgi:RND family efflux transporter MFP subunit
MRDNGRTIIWILVIGALVAIFVITAIGRLRKEEVLSIDQIQQRDGIPVDVVQARVIAVEEWREYVGVAEGYEQVDLTVDSRSRVNNVNAAVGEKVPRGSVIVSLDPYDPARAANNLSSARARYNATRNDSIRMEALYASGAVSLQQLDQIRAGTEAARVSFVTATRAVRLDTPINGLVTALYVNPGDYADAGQVVATVASLDQIRIPLSISSDERSRIEVGAPVRVRTEQSRVGTGQMDSETRPNVRQTRHSDGVFIEGTVVRAALSADTETRLFSVEAVVDNPHHMLRPGSLVQVEILVASTTGRPAVPPGALIEDGESTCVYSVSVQYDSLRAAKLPVQVGARNSRHVAIEKGLRPNERVVVWGQTKLADGALIRIHADLTEQHYGKNR